MFEKRVVIGKKYCIFAPGPVTVTADMNNIKVTLVNAIESGKYFFTAPTTKIYSSVNPSCIFEPDNTLNYNIGNTPSWLYSLKVSLQILLGETAVKLNLAENKLIVHAVGMDDTQLEAVTTLLTRVLPKNINVEHTNYILPTGYKKLEYLESTGTQYINTQFIPAEEAQIDIEFMDTSSSSAYRVICGVNEVTTIGTWRFNIAYQDYRWIQAEYGWWHPLANIEKNTKHRIFFKSIVNDFATCVHQVDGQLIPSDYTPSVMYRKGSLTAGTEPLFLFARNTANKAPSVGNNHFTGRIYMVHLKNTNGEEAYLIPAIDSVTKQPGMYDTVNKVFKINAGYGDFTYPGKETEATTYSLRNRMYGKITEHGIRRLYCVPEGYSSKEEYAEANGFKLIVEPPMPEEGYWSPVWHDREDCIELEWVETEPPTEESI